MKILIIKLSSFGDILHSLPVLAAIKERLPEAKVSWLLSEKFGELLEGHPQLDKLYKLPSSPLDWPKSISKIKQENFDYILDLQGLIKTGLIASWIGGKEIVGISPARERLAEVFWTRIVSSSAALEPSVHIIERNLSILQGLDLKPIQNHPVNYNLPEPNAEIPDYLKEDFIVCAPESRWKSKEWPQAHWDALIENLCKLPLPQIVIMGSKPTEEKAKFDRTKVLDLRGQTPRLSQVQTIVAKAKLLIGSDSALIHLGAAYGRKTLGLYGPTSPGRSGPWNGETLWLNLACSPCHKRCCPLVGAEYLGCLKGLHFDTVEAKVKELLGL